MGRILQKTPSEDRTNFQNENTTEELEDLQREEITTSEVLIALRTIGINK